MNAVIYARYSSAGQRDVSIEDQIREITAYADCHNLTITHTYADRKTTGRSTDKRKDFLRMIADSDKHAFQCVLIYKFDRFARNKYDAVIYKKRLKDNGVKVIAVAEPIPDGYGAKILESIYEAMAEEYSENLSQNIRRGQKGNALKCYANHKAPFGYLINHETHKYDIDTGFFHISLGICLHEISAAITKYLWLNDYYSWEFCFFKCKCHFYYAS